jgi:hypothetical protein
MTIRALIGYLAQVSQYEVLCDGDACVVIGVKSKLKDYLTNNALTKKDEGYALKRAWFDDILAGLGMGGAYAFDEEAYKLFYPLAQRAGLPVEPEDFSVLPPAAVTKAAIHLVRVQLLPPSRR